MSAKYYEHKGLRLSRGNGKVKSGRFGKQTLILNMGSGTDCPNREICKVVAMDKAGLPVRCYAECAEIWLPNSALAYRRRQAEFWQSHTATEIVHILHELLSVKNKGIMRGQTIEAFRFNESGDMGCQDDAEKVAVIADYLRDEWGVKRIWLYTSSRRWADYLSTLSQYVTVKGSGFAGPHGMTIVVPGSETPIPQGFRECPGDCSKCVLCAVKGINVAFRAHGSKTNICKDITPEQGKAALIEFYGPMVGVEV